MFPTSENGLHVDTFLLQTKECPLRLKVKEIDARIERKLSIDNSPLLSFLLIKL